MKLAVVVGGWHYPLHPFVTIQRTPLPPGWSADYFCVGHRDPDLPIVRSEKRPLVIEHGDQALRFYDETLYAQITTRAELAYCGWQLVLRPNTCGDWGYLNQWLEETDWQQYDAVWWLHDDTYFFDDSTALLHDVLPLRALVVGHGKYPEAPPCYLRGSFEFFSREFLEMIGGKFELGEPTMTREGHVDTPSAFQALSEWNATCEPTRQFLERKGVNVEYLSPHYRVSKYAIEGERGFISAAVGAPWSFVEGVNRLLMSAA